MTLTTLPPFSSFIVNMSSEAANNCSPIFLFMKF